MFKQICRCLVMAPLVWTVFATPGVRGDDPVVKGYWAVRDVREGMKGYGKTVIHGTKVERFEAEILGVQRNVSPGRDMILARLSGCGLEKTGIIAGMSGSPIYIDGKLLGAVAYAWPYGKDPIAGVTPFEQMVGFAANLRKDYLADAGYATPAASPPRVKLWDEEYHTLWERRGAVAAGGTRQALGMSQIKMPLVAAGFSPRTMSSLGELAAPLAMIPVLGGTAGGESMEAAANVPLQPGGPLNIAMVTGDFDLSGVGTVTHIEGDRVYGFGHPMFSLGKCQFPLMTGYIHVVYPSQNISFKMASPLRAVGVVDTDVSTCVAGKLGDQPAMVPMEVVLRRKSQPREHSYKVQIVRQRELLPSLAFTVLMAAVDTEGNLPEEMTVNFHARVKPKGYPPLEVRDVYSGSQFAGQFGPFRIYSIVPNLVNALVTNPFEEIEIESIRCVTEIEEGRQSADIGKVRLSSDVYEPGDTVVAEVELEPYKGAPKYTEVKLELPKPLPSGRYRAVVCDAPNSVGSDLRNQPHLLAPQDSAQLFRVLHLQLRERRNNVYLRVMTRDTGVALKGQALPNLPGSMAQILIGSRRSGTLPIRTELVAKTETPYAVQGARVLYFTVVQNKHVFDPQ